MISKSPLNQGYAVCPEEDSKGFKGLEKAKFEGPRRSRGSHLGSFICPATSCMWRLHLDLPRSRSFFTI
eukprot:c28258_g1_i1 orf=46-252(+)